MKNATIIVCVILGMALLATSQETTPDFRKASWGMSMAQVKATEKEKPLQEQNGKKALLVYADRVAGLSCKVIYIFAKDKLTRTKYILAESHTNKNQYLSDYDTLQSALKQKYGNPQKDNSFWHNDLYKDNPDEWGMAVAVGHLKKYTQWTTTKTIITMSIGGDNFDITSGVEYASKELQPLEETVDKEEDGAKL